MTLSRRELEQLLAAVSGRLAGLSGDQLISHKELVALRSRLSAEIEIAAGREELDRVKRAAKARHARRSWDIKRLRF